MADLSKFIEITDPIAKTFRRLRTQLICSYEKLKIPLHFYLKLTSSFLPVALALVFCMACPEFINQISL
jgi:hypothetical protein